MNIVSPVGVTAAACAAGISEIPKYMDVCDLVI